MPTSDDLAALNSEVFRLYQDGDYQAATPVADRALKHREQAFGPGHADISTSLHILVGLYRVDNRLAFRHSEETKICHQRIPVGRGRYAV